MQILSLKRNGEYLTKYAFRLKVGMGIVYDDNLLYSYMSGVTFY